MSNRAREPRPSRCLLLIALAISLIGAAAIVFLPIGWPLNRFIVWLYYTGRGMGIPSFVTIEVYDTALNLLLFALPVALAAAVWPRVPWWLWALIALIASAAVELVQFAALPRDASAADVLADTLGAMLGAGATALVKAWIASSCTRTR